MKLSKTELRYVVSDRCIQNLEKKEKEKLFDRNVKYNKMYTLEQCFEQNQRMILNGRDF